MAADITTGLYAHYVLGSDQADGVIKDLGSNGLDLTVVANGAFPTRTSINRAAARLFSRAGTSGSTAARSNYAERAVNQATAQAFVGGPMTFSYWYRRSPAVVGEGTGNELPLLFSGDGTGVSLSRLTSITARSSRVSQKIGVGWGTSLGANTPFYNTLAVDSVWHHYTHTIYQSSAGKAKSKLYVDGVYVEETAEFNEPFFWSLPCDAYVIGISGLALSATVGQVGGYLRGMRLYSRALTDEDIAALPLAVDDTPNLTEVSAGVALTATFGTPRAVKASNLIGAATLTVTAGRVSAAAPITTANTKSSAVIG